MTPPYVLAFTSKLLALEFCGLVTLPKNYLRIYYIICSLNFSNPKTLFSVVSLFDQIVSKIWETRKSLLIVHLDVRIVNGKYILHEHPGPASLYMEMQTR